MGAITGNKSSMLSQFRLIRVLRVIRLVGMFERLTTLVEAFIHACTQAAWVGVLCFIIFYIFAILARELFGRSAKLRKNPEYNYQWFENVPSSLFTLFQLMTMDGESPLCICYM